ncbi:hypothetical protein OCGS_0401 [Oceaniovalibus guishaninsula JLT2003]|uniref:Uncharacterized protein n=2 Tax=Oceaniovalibus TaxID=1207070 RepID=K2GRQ5_9RHOB|nr:hypothetical protein OCGS_0401 [Oceaniovalibus guishaninsula JLT2003]
MRGRGVASRHVLSRPGPMTWSGGLLWLALALLAIVALGVWNVAWVIRAFRLRHKGRDEDPDDGRGGR